MEIIKAQKNESMCRLPNIPIDHTNTCFKAVIDFLFFFIYMYICKACCGSQRLQCHYLFSPLASFCLLITHPNNVLYFEFSCTGRHNKNFGQ